MGVGKHVCEYVKLSMDVESLSLCQNLNKGIIVEWLHNTTMSSSFSNSPLGWLIDWCFAYWLWEGASPFHWLYVWKDSSLWLHVFCLCWNGQFFYEKVSPHSLREGNAYIDYICVFVVAVNLQLTRGENLIPSHGREFRKPSLQASCFRRANEMGTDGQRKGIYDGTFIVWEIGFGANVFLVLTRPVAAAGQCWSLQSAVRDTIGFVPPGARQSSSGFCSWSFL